VIATSNEVRRDVTYDSRSTLSLARGYVSHKLHDVRELVRVIRIRIGKRLLEFNVLLWLHGHMERALDVAFNAFHNVLA
jgi:hypothetical protein